jgi:hypothetical protein
MEEITTPKKLLIMSGSLPEEALPYINDKTHETKTIVITPYGNDTILTAHEPEITKSNASEYGLDVYTYRDLPNLADLYPQLKELDMQRVFMTFEVDYRELKMYQFSFLDFYKKADTIPEIFIHLKRPTNTLDDLIVYRKVITPIFSKSFTVKMKNAPMKNKRDYFTVEQLASSVFGENVHFKIKGQYGVEYGTYPITSPMLKELYDEYVIAITHYDHYKDTETLQVEIEDTARQILEFDKHA